MATEEENEIENPEISKNSFEKLGDLDSHLIRHRELFLSRQMETYKIDMVRYVSGRLTGRECILYNWLFIRPGNLYSLSVTLWC